MELDGDVHPYLVVLMGTNLARVGEAFVVLKGIYIRMIMREAFDNMLLREASYNHDNYGLFCIHVLGLGLEWVPK